MRRIEIAQIECRVAARIPSQQVETLLARLFDDGRIRRNLDDDQVLAESKDQIDHLAADATGTANDDVPATMHRAQALHPDPMYPRQQRGAEGDEEAGNDGARQHQQHRVDDIERVAPVGCQIPVAGRGHGRDDEVDGVEPTTFEDGAEVPGADQKYDERCQREADEDRIEPRRLTATAVQQRAQPSAKRRVAPCG
jgi:hypothetical protein